MDREFVAIASIEKRLIESASQVSGERERQMSACLSIECK